MANSQYGPIQNLGKIVLTCEGQWIDRKYDKLCIVYDRYYASYISKREVPLGVSLDDEHFWQPLSKMDKLIISDYEGFKTKVVEFIAWAQIKIAGTRIVVADDDERNALELPNVGPGCEVYVRSTGNTWILNTIDTLGNKTWKLEDAKIDGHPVSNIELEDNVSISISDRAVSDVDGNNIIDTYVTYETIKNYIKSVGKEYFSQYIITLQNGQVSWDNLSDTLKSMFVGKANIINHADDEDLAVMPNNTLKFKPRHYKHKSFNGLGYHILRRHFACNVNMLDQQAISEKNTIYEIRYDFELNDDVVRIPEHSILYFNGGSIRHGTIILNDTMIIGITKLSDAFKEVVIDGTFHTGQVLLSDENNMLAYWVEDEWKYLVDKDYVTAAIQEAVSNLDFGDVYADLTDIKNRLDDYDSRITNLETSLSNLESKVTNLETSLSNLESKVTNLETSLSNLESKVTNLETSLSNLENRVTNLETSLSNLENRVTSIETSLSNLENRVTSIETSLSNLENVVNNLVTEVSNIEKSIGDLETRVSALEDAVADLRNDLSNYLTKTEAASTYQKILNHYSEIYYSASDENASQNAATLETHYNNKYGVLVTRIDNYTAEVENDPYWTTSYTGVQGSFIELYCQDRTKESYPTSAIYLAPDFLQLSVNHLYGEKIVDDDDDYGTQRVVLDRNGLWINGDRFVTIADVGNIGIYTSVDITAVPSDTKYGRANISKSVTLGIDGTIPNGADVHLVVYNESSTDAVVTIPTTFIVTDSMREVNVSSGGYCEISILKIGSYMYVRSGIEY